MWYHVGAVNGMLRDGGVDTSTVQENRVIHSKYQSNPFLFDFSDFVKACGIAKNLNIWEQLFVNNDDSYLWSQMFPKLWP